LGEANFGAWTLIFSGRDLPHHCHIISMSFPRQQSQWVNIWGPEWHFCKSEWQSGSFVIMSGKGDMTTRIRSAWGGQPLHHLQPLFKTSIFVLQASMDVPLAVFHVFGSFLPFLCIFDNTHWGFYVWNSFSCLGSSFCGFYWLGTIPIHGVFAFIYDITVLHSI